MAHGVKAFSPPLQKAWQSGCSLVAGVCDTVVPMIVAQEENQRLGLTFRDLPVMRTPPKQALAPEGSTASQNSATIWAPHVQTSESVGDISDSNYISIK